METESFFSLLRDPAHWEFELFLIFVFDVVIGAFVWPHLKKFTKHHKDDDEKIRDLEERIKNLEGKSGS